jgi:hypothetical protein
MATRYYRKTDFLYSTDQGGTLVEPHIKRITLPAQIAANSSRAIQLLDPNNAKTIVYEFDATIYLASGAKYVSAAGADATTYVLANNVLTISVPASGTAVPSGAIIRILYFVGGA